MPRKTTDLIVVHCSATKPTMDVGVKEIDRWHRARGFLEIGYHYIIRRDGSLETGRNIDDAGAHARGYNHRSIGVCMVGGVHETKMQGRWPAPDDNFTEDQWTTLEDLLKNLRNDYPEISIIGHNEISSKACPSFDVQEYLLKVFPQ